MPSKNKIKTKKQSGGVPLGLETILLTTVVSSVLSMIGTKLFSYKKYLNAAKSYEEVLFVIQKNYESSKMFIEQNINITKNLIRNTKIEIKFFENALIGLEKNIVIRTEDLNDEMKEYDKKVSTYSKEKLLKELDSINEKIIPEEPCNEGKMRKPAKGILRKYCEKGNGSDNEGLAYDKPIEYEGNMYCCETIKLDKSEFTLKRDIILSKIDEKKVIEDELERLRDELSDLEFTFFQLNDQNNDYVILIQTIVDKMKDLNRLSAIQVNMGNLLVELSNKFKKEGIDITKEPYASKLKDKIIIQKITKKVEEEGLFDRLEQIDIKTLKKQKDKNSDKFSPEVKLNIETMEKINQIAYDIFKTELVSIGPVKIENNNLTESNKIKELEAQLNKTNTAKDKIEEKNKKLEMESNKKKKEEKIVISEIKDLNKAITNIEMNSKEQISKLKYEFDNDRFKYEEEIKQLKSLLEKKNNKWHRKLTRKIKKIRKKR